MKGLAVEPGRLVTYKPLCEDMPKDERHRVKVIELHRDVVDCEDVFGNRFQLTWGRIEKVEEDEGGRWQTLAKSLTSGS